MQLTPMTQTNQQQTCKHITCYDVIYINVLCGILGTELYKSLNAMFL